MMLKRRKKGNPLEEALHYQKHPRKNDTVF